ncbi:MAG: hypothetical protein J6R77_07765 [Clostridia bacterium]|nr:hypothetical protein [Clostridia bacterium]
MKTVYMLGLCIALLLCFGGCRDKEVQLPADFLLLPNFTAQEGELLGQNRTQMWGSLYTLEGLPPERYLYLKSDAEDGWYLCMHKYANTPVCQFEVKRIEITQTTGQPVVLTEEPIINRLLAAVRTNTGEKVENPTAWHPNVTVYLDVPCELTWRCSIEQEEAGMRLLYCDEKTGQWYSHDVSDILADVEGLALPFPQFLPESE